MVANTVQLLGAYARHDMRFYEIQNVGGEAARDTHFLDFCCRFNSYGHESLWVMGADFYRLETKVSAWIVEFICSWYKALLDLATSHTCRHILRGAAVAYESTEVGEWGGWRLNPTRRATGLPPNFVQEFCLCRL